MARPPTTASGQGVEALKDISCGSVAGMVGKVFEYPFDTVKVRLQSQPNLHPPQYTGAVDCFKQSLQKDGLRGIYRGLYIPMVGAAVENAFLFWTYRLSQDLLKASIYSSNAHGEKLPLGALVTAGAMSGSVTSIVLTPIELVKCRVQVPSQSPLDPTLRAAPSARVIIADVWRRDGLAGFWRGQMGTLLRETGGGAAWFGSYEFLSLYFQRRLANPETDDIPIWQRMVAGAVAGMAYNFAFFPADTIKSKIQTGELTGAQQQRRRHVEANTRAASASPGLHMAMSSFMNTINSNARSNRGTAFQPQTRKKGTNSWQLKQFAEATLGSGSLRKVVQLPEGEDRDEWLAVNVVDFYNQINLLYGAITEFCSPQSCPEMKATDEFEYLWHDPPEVPKPTRLPAPTYISHLLSWTSNHLANSTTFPTHPGVPFPPNFQQTIRTIFKRLYRIYAHIYCHHYSVIRGLGLEAHLNTGFKHYVLFVEEFGLADEKGNKKGEWYGPLGELVESMLRSD
ncbi:hypothetical protein BST61_g5342 [Cercospora zeina]